jgi:putative PEP-CTERM system histidine kinase
MLTSLNVLSHSVAALAFLILALLVITRYFRRMEDRALFFAAIATSVWSMTIVAQDLWGAPGFIARYGSELIRDFAWLIVLFAMFRIPPGDNESSVRIKTILKLAVTGLFTLLITLLFFELITGVSLLGGKARILGQIALALAALTIIEQIWRNSLAFGRSNIKYSCVGIATIFIYDFVMYADALLFGEIAHSFWNARGFINAAMVPLFAVHAINTIKQPVDFRLSRTAVFHASTLIFAGGYLLFLALGGYYVKTLGGNWGEALQALFVTVSLAFLTTLLLSRRLRARLLVRISQNFFDYKYDYREEWLKLTRELADLSGKPPLTERVIRILAGLVESNGGALWLKGDQNSFVLKAALNMSTPRHTTIDQDDELCRFFSNREWIINLHEYQEDPVSYNLLEIPDAITKTPDSWLIIPLYLGNELYGMALVGNPYARVELNWENFDLIKVVARQTCNLLAQADAQNRLSRAMQFEAVSKASAFMVHDLKTVIAQLSLLVKNAPRHRNNPAFIDDMINTTDHAVRKMSSLVDHIRRPGASAEEAPLQPLDLTKLMRELVEHHQHQSPRPRLEGNASNVIVMADLEQLTSVLGHLIQNAQDATPADGDISITIKIAKGNVVLFIQDTGTGMTKDFIATQLFKPFESTKGLTGMGIGAYQAREYIRAIGGNIDVTSERGVGSCFSVQIPLARQITSEKGSEELPPDSAPINPMQSAN